MFNIKIMIFYNLTLIGHNGSKGLVFWAKFHTMAIRKYNVKGSL
jgi:hypothetical protein